MAGGIRVATPPPRPLLVFDGDCGFCALWILRWQEATGEALDYLPSRDPSVGAWFPEIPAEDYRTSVQLVETDGRVYSGAEAVFRALAHGPSHRSPLRLYQFSRAFARTMEFAYRVVARHRGFFSWMTRALWGDHVLRPTHVLARWFFLRAMAVIYLVAFLSLWGQILGLLGHDGILPARHFMTEVADAYRQHGIGFDRIRLVPTLCWINSSDGFLVFQCAAGVVLALLLLVGVAPAPSLALLWLLYLSLATVGRRFLGYQWDNLLLETGFLAIIVAPWQLWPRRRATEPPGLALWLLRLLLFKLMFSSGCVKLASGDLNWRNLTALSFHYQTQPLPTWLAWYANQLPLWFHKASCLAMFVIEIGAALLVFFPRRLRLVGCGFMASLQILILLTGNYTFFNLLALALCLALVDDVAFRQIVPSSLSRMLDRGHPLVAQHGRRWHRAATVVVAFVFVPISLAQTSQSWGAHPAWLSPLESAEAWLGPLRTVSGYGLFAVMTSDRREIIVEGSDDGVTWLAYEFKWKPGDVNRRPAFVAPHQPRVDWQMWFAALGNFRENRWFVNFCLRLLQGSPRVLELLAKNPFPSHPPKYLRAELYEYAFTEAAERRATGAWWRRERIGEYLPRIALSEP